jgi:hypothetical protein
MATSQIYTPTHKRYSDWGNVTPQFEVSEGIRPAQAFLPAPYLPIVRYNEYYREYFVISAGTPVALDSNGFLIPAGLAAQFLTAYLSGSNTLDMTTADYTKYTASDVTAGVKNALGTAVVANEPVIASWFGYTDSANWDDVDTTATPVLTAFYPAVGFATYDYWMTSFVWAPSAATAAGVTAEARALLNSELSPYKYRYHNYALQGIVGITTRAFVEVPVAIVTDFGTDLDVPVFGGMARGAQISGGSAAAGNIFVPGCPIGYDVHSRYIPTLADPNTAASIVDLAGNTEANVESGFLAYHNAQRKINGVCLAFEPLSAYPKDKLAYVRTAYNLTGFSGTDKMPGSATSGYPDTITFAAESADTTYANIAGVARINLVFNAH